MAYKKFLDVEKVIAEKSPRLARLLPGFAKRYLKRIIHEDFLNGLLNNYEDKQGLDFIDAVLADFGANIRVIGEENLRKTDRFVIVSNHPLGGLDGMALIQAVGRVHRNVVFPVNDLLMHIPNLRPLFIPVNKHGSNAENIKSFNDTFASDKKILYFPAGLCSRKTDGQIMDLQWMKTVLTKARASQRDIVPVHIEGKNSNFFYNLSNFRKRIGLKANIEMLFLVDEMVKQKDKDITITIGEPIPIEVFDKSRKDNEWMQRLKDFVYTLEKNPTNIFTQ